MNNPRFEDLLDTESRQMSLGGTTGPASTRSPDALLLAPLLELARDIAAVMLPVRMRPAFRAELRLGLVAAARQHEAQQMVFLFPDGTQSGAGRAPAIWLDRVSGLAESAGQGWNEIGQGERRLMVGAAAALSLAGILAYVLHQRSRVAA